MNNEIVNNKKYKNKEDYPLMLEPKHIQEIMGIGRRQTYDFLNEIEFKINKGKNPPFHLKRLGKLFKIPREGFFDWLEGKSETKARG
jgi:hypothetical protein